MGNKQDVHAIGGTVPITGSVAIARLLGVGRLAGIIDSTVVCGSVQLYHMVLNEGRSTHKHIESGLSSSTG